MLNYPKNNENCIIVSINYCYVTEGLKLPLFFFGLKSGRVRVGGKKNFGFGFGLGGKKFSGSGSGWDLFFFSGSGSGWKKSNPSHP